MSYQAVLFDLDGTLLDTLEDIVAAANKTLVQMGYPTHSLDEYRYFIGDGAATLIKRALPEKERKEENIQSGLALFIENYQNLWNIHTKVYPGIVALLDGLKKENLKLAVLSNKPHSFTVQCVEAYLSSWDFAIVIGQQEHLAKKPAPDGAIEIATRLQIPPEKFLYLGDTGVDMKTAVAAKMFAVGVLWGFRSAEELKENGAQLLLQDPLELLDYLKISLKEESL